jgi:hypothetical protein
MNFSGRDFRETDKCPQLTRGTTGGSDNTVKEEASDPDASMARRVGSIVRRGLWLICSAHRTGAGLTNPTLGQAVASEAPAAYAAVRLV